MTTQQWFKDLPFSYIKHRIKNCYKIYGVHWSELESMTNLQKLEVFRLSGSVKRFIQNLILDDKLRVLYILISDKDYRDPSYYTTRPLPKLPETKMDRRYKEEKITYKTAKLSL